MDPIRPIGLRDERIAPVTRVAETHVRRETDEEMHERRQREARERERKRAARAWSDSQLRALQRQHVEAGIVSEDDSDDGRAHVDIRI